MKKYMVTFLSSMIMLGIYAGTVNAYEYYDEPPFETYKVSEGDALSYIGKRFGVELEDLYSYNPDLEENLVITGSTINLVGGYTSNNNLTDSQRTALNANDRDLIERLVHAEARGQEYKGKVAVAEVVFNRVDSNDFPNSVNEVIMEERQFEPIASGTINNNPDAETKEAVQEALEGTDFVEGALFFWNPTIATSRWLEEKKVVTQIDSHEFLE
ncbi:cell wall hydrolase [Salipaludibacillus sp. HK11]|uniref:cell wall hydrolase n=1 Tax=Salipaludibacillus sp. HK11 TaxID=3394320 RepID=UPI0039FBF927